MGAGLEAEGSLRALFKEAVELPPEERAEFVARVDISSEIRQELLAMLAVDQGSDTFLHGIVTAEHPAPPAAGQRFGPYETRALLGQGGMGMVFRAERVDGELTQTVAIKVVRQAWLDPRALDRFRNERQLLAGLAHANIARLLDGGATDDGLPYLVMEFIDGVPLQHYREERHLDIAATLRLFLPLCDAVEYAHSRLVIHRDLKPSNVLVTAAGEPKLLDFGIAKALDTAPGVETRTISLTPEFASPEQFRGDQATTAIDVHGLGGVLYFLLTGQPIHSISGLSPGELHRAIVETPPRLPSQLRPELKGDLDNILMKALHVEPTRRYRSAAEFRDDLQRYLDRRPVLATRDGFVYRAKRFLQRHAMASVAAVIALIAVVGGVAMSLYEARRAEQRFAQVRTLANRFVFDFEAAIRDTPGTLEARRMAAATARQYLDDLSADAGRDPALKRELAESYYRLSQVELAAGQSEASMRAMKRSIALLKELGNDTRGTTNQRAKYIAELANLAVAQANLMAVDEGIRTTSESVGVARTWVAEPGHPVEAETALATALHGQANLMLNRGRISEARAALEEALALAPAVERNPDVTTRHVLVLAGVALARVLDTMADPAAALATIERAQPILDNLLALHPGNSAWGTERVSLLALMGDYLTALSDKDRALRTRSAAAYEEAMSYAQQLVARNPGNRVVLQSASFAAMKLANHLKEEHRTVEALPLLRKSIGYSDELLLTDENNKRYRYIQVSNQHLLASYLVDLGRWRDARAELAKSEQMMTAALAKSPGDLQLLRRDVAILIDEATTERNLRNLPEARHQCQRALDVAATVINRQKGAKRPLGSSLADLRREAKLLGITDFTLGIPGIE